MMITVFAKGARANPTTAERDALAAAEPPFSPASEPLMTKRIVDKILEGVSDVHALALASGDASAGVVHRIGAVDVKAIRGRSGLSQDAFAARYGFSAGAVRDWEQGRKPPEPTARVLLTVIDREPEAVGRALSLDAFPS